jgi:hypothetical protein
MSRKRTKAPRTSSRVLLSTLGEVKEIVYKHFDGRLMRHKFNRGVLLGVMPDGKSLVITPINVKPFIEG